MKFPVVKDAENDEYVYLKLLHFPTPLTARTYNE